MKRPQGFDRPPQPPAAPPSAQRAPSASQRPSTPAANPATPSAASKPVSPPPASKLSRPSAPGVGRRSDERATTEPIPVVASRTSTTPVDDDRSPSNREIRAALRGARKERARVERGEVRRFTKRSRRRRFIWIGALGTAAVLVVGVALTAFSPLMALRTIDVVGTNRVKASDVSAALKGQLGRPLPLVDFGAIRSDLAAFPLIRSFSTESHPPSTLVVRIVERVPIGVVVEGSKFRLVDAAKVTISSGAARPAGFPVIAASGAAGGADTPSGFAAAVAVLQALPPSVLGSVDTITAATKDDVTFTLLGSGAKVVWGSADQSDLKSADLAALIKSGGANSASVFDVSSPHSVVKK